jgi:tellurite resistance protein TehA-like permease
MDGEEHRGWRKEVKTFTSQWFLIPQGTGIIAIILHQLPYQFNGLLEISEIFWILTIIFIFFTLSIYLLRTILFPHKVIPTLTSDISELSCLASISITFTSIIQMLCLVSVKNWGYGWSIAAFVLWWINTAMSVSVCIGMPYVFVKYSSPGVNNVPGAAQLPLIAALTSAAGGGILCQYAQLSARLQVPVVIVSYLLIAMALPLSLGYDTLFLLRLFENSGPKQLKLFQEMILCGPWGQSSFALQSLGTVVSKGAFAEYGRGTFLSQQATQPIAFISYLSGLMAWGQGTFWWAFTIISILQPAISRPKVVREMGFGLTAWSLVFPWVS